MHLASARLEESVVILLPRLLEPRASTTTYPLATVSGTRTSIAKPADGRSAGGLKNRQ